jgi:GTPase-activator protein for Ras-like GTPase
MLQRMPEEVRAVSHLIYSAALKYCPDLSLPLVYVRVHVLSCVLACVHVCMCFFLVFLLICLLLVFRLYFFFPIFSGGLVMLRYFSPSIVSPEKFLGESSPSSKARRNLVLIAKVLQNCSNGVRFGPKEVGC